MQPQENEKGGSKTKKKKKKHLKNKDNQDRNIFRKFYFAIILNNSASHSPSHSEERKKHGSKY